MSSCTASPCDCSRQAETVELIPFIHGDMFGLYANHHSSYKVELQYFIFDYSTSLSTDPYTTRAILTLVLAQRNCCCHILYQQHSHKQGSRRAEGVACVIDGVIGHQYLQGIRTPLTSVTQTYTEPAN